MVKRILLLGCTMALPLFAFPWGKQGRHLVTEIARGLMDPKTIAAVDQVLGTSAWADASDWLDATATPRNTTIRQQWQRVLIPRDKTYVPTKGPNLVNQLEYNMMVLEKRAIFPAKDVAESIKILFNLVASAHQPLRCGNTEDQGGANVRLHYGGKSGTLLKLWDDDLFELKKTDMWECSKVLIGIPQQERLQLQTAGHTIWISESRALLKDVYSFQGGAADDAYLDRMKKIALRQVVNAGIRLAALLNRNFKE
jgi:hypothetical protein